jgi:CRISPR-associated endonuclease Cas2
MHFLVAYDIADPKRLRRVARCMERRAIRCQKSVFWFDGTADALARLLEEVRPLIDPAADVVQAWCLAAGQDPCGLALGAAADIRPAAVVLAPPHWLGVRRPRQG